MDARLLAPLLEEVEGVAEVRAEWEREREATAVEGESFNRFIEWLSEREQDGLAMMGAVDVARSLGDSRWPMSKHG